MKLINKKFHRIYKINNKFLSKNGKFYHDLWICYNKIKNKIYHGFIDELNDVYNNNASTTNIRKSIKTLFNWTKLNHLTINDDRKLVLINNDNDKKCPVCGNHRSFIPYH